MIEAHHASQLILSEKADFGDTLVSLDEAIGRVLAESIIADRDFPPFDRVCMDGIAIAHSAFAKGQRRFIKQSIQAAGEPPQTLNDDSYCIEIMTGASLPKGADTVVRYEDLTTTDDGFEINAPYEAGKNVHLKGRDHRKGEILIQPSKRLNAMDIGVLATVGKDKVLVKKQPKIAIVSTGDELVGVKETPLPFQIRKSNVRSLHARLTQKSIPSIRFHISDNPKAIKEDLACIIDNFDVILMSGGVSKGKFDHVPNILTELGIQKLFHRVKQRPGKPFWFGRNDTTFVFAFPGNPVSTMTCFTRYFMPWYEQCMRQSFTPMKVVLKSPIHFKPDLTYFAQVKLSQNEQAQWLAEVSHGNGSGDLVNPLHTDGFVELPRGQEVYDAGLVVDFYRF